MRIPPHYFVGGFHDHDCSCSYQGFGAKGTGKRRGISPSFRQERSKFIFLLVIRFGAFPDRKMPTSAAVLRFHSTPSKQPMCRRRWNLEEGECTRRSVRAAYRLTLGVDL
jgi:hypothetical protein